MVRKNAATLFIDVFPLREPNLTKEQSSVEFDKQFDLLRDLTKDSNPQVRSIAVEGLCKMLMIFWELRPIENSYKMLKAVVEKMAFDQNAPIVRISALKGIAYMCDNHLIHPSLKSTFIDQYFYQHTELLPSLSTLANDPSQAVRFQLFALLNRVKSIRDIKFFDIVPADDILLRLAVEHGTVKDKICQLLLNSYFPYNHPPSQQVRAYSKLTM